MAQKNTGKPSEQAFENRLSSLGKAAYFYAIKDASDIRGLTGKIGYVDATPSDYIIVLDGQLQFAEVKSSIDPDRFHFSLLRKGQSSHGTRILAAGGIYNVYAHRLSTGEWYKISLTDVNTLKQAKTASLLWTEMDPWNVSRIS